MPFTNSARGQLDGVVPTGPTEPAVVAHLQNLVDKVEPRLVLRVTTITNAATELGTLENGMLVETTTAPYELHFRKDNAWTKLYPRNYSGTGVPANSLGANGDGYDRYV